MDSSSPTPPAASAAVATSSTATASHGFRAPSNVMASIPRFFAKMASLGYVGTAADPASITNSPVPAVAEAFTTLANATAGAAASQVSGNATGGSSPPAPSGAFDGGIRGVSSVVTYATSKWALLCLFMSVLLNRTPIYASLRRPIRLPFKMRLLIRIVPVAMLAYQIFHMMFAMRCQTSPIFHGERKTGAAWHGSDLFFHTVGRMGSFWLDDRAVCENIGMIPDSDWVDRAFAIKELEKPEVDIPQPKGSLDILWPLYKTLSFSQFVEVFTCSLVVWEPFETGMTLLEHSLAFAEAEALATRQTYRLEMPRDGSQGPKVFKIEGEKLVPPEVLYISIISSLSHITFHVMAVFNRRTRYRLLTTSFYGLAFLGAFAIALLHGGTAGILDFPTISVVGFIPHLLILAGIAICAGIYGLALLLSSLFPPSGRRGFTEGFSNLRANLTLSTASISLAEDFFSVLLKLGYVCLTAAAEATYLNEGRAVRIPGWTWLESERARMLDSHLRNSGNISSQFSQTARGVGPFAQERREFRGVVESAKNKRRGGPAHWIGAGELLRGVGAVVGRWGVVGTSRLLGRAPPVQEPAVLPPDSDDDSTLYKRFLEGVSLPETDESTDYIPPADFGDDGSCGSSDVDNDDGDDGDSGDNGDNSDHGDNGDDNDDDDGGRSRSVSASHRGHREATPLLDPAHLAALLDPQTPEDRASARILAQHLTASHPLTRAQYTSLNVSGAAEESALETILLSRRRGRKKQDGDGNGGDREEEHIGPVCVVCQSEPRTVIVWPCRCLSLCEDCRICLAMNNWSNCVTCRVPSIGYSRVYVP